MPIAEKALISRIRRAAAGRKLPGMVLGIGDDTAILDVPRGYEILLTTDFTLETVHFRREWHPPESVGHRCLARGLSDIAAMGGEPLAAFLSLALPGNLPQSWVDRFMKGLLALARRHGVALAGGDTAQSPSGALADIVVVGSAPKGRAVKRSGARFGDLLYVTGELGAAAATLEALYGGRKLSPPKHPRHFFPDPRLVIGRGLREQNLATSMIDLSDGLSTDLAHICEESGVGARVEAESLPIAKDAKLQHALHGGDDYELLFTAQPSKKVPRQLAGVRITRIGEIIQSGIFVVSGGKRTRLKPCGWEHFRT